MTRVKVTYVAIDSADNWFHQTWVRAEAQQNDFLPIKLPWYVHPERDEAWRKKQMDINLL